MAACSSMLSGCSRGLRLSSSCIPFRRAMRSRLRSSAFSSCDLTLLDVAPILPSLRLALTSTPAVPSSGSWCASPSAAGRLMSPGCSGEWPPVDPLSVFVRARPCGEPAGEAAPWWIWRTFSRTASWSAVRWGVRNAETVRPLSKPCTSKRSNSSGSTKAAWSFLSSVAFLALCHSYSLRASATAATFLSSSSARTSGSSTMSALSTFLPPAAASFSSSSLSYSTWTLRTLRISCSFFPSAASSAARRSSSSFWCWTLFGIGATVGSDMTGSASGLATSTDDGGSMPSISWAKSMPSRPQVKSTRSSNDMSAWAISCECESCSCVANDPCSSRLQPRSSTVECSVRSTRVPWERLTVAPVMIVSRYARLRIGSSTQPLGSMPVDGSGGGPIALSGYRVLRLYS
mmetsp:Transcript_35256/g.108812  ORF Transcript_35256/g.108812 Transcript_35256/m.108812 type:complete len:403 (-) Transcript_35256:2008-3216(-)